jgi:microtubule-associated protein 1 light chain
MLKREKITNMLVKYPDKIPVVLKITNENKIKMEQKKFLIPNDLTLTEFMFTIRRRMTLNSTQAFFIYFNDKYMERQTETMQNIYNKYQSPDDKILYVTISAENTFG